MLNIIFDSSLIFIKTRKRSTS